MRRTCPSLILRCNALQIMLSYRTKKQEQYEIKVNIKVKARIRVNVGVIIIKVKAFVPGDIFMKTFQAMIYHYKTSPIIVRGSTKSAVWRYSFQAVSTTPRRQKFFIIIIHVCSSIDCRNRLDMGANDLILVK